MVAQCFRAAAPSSHAAGSSPSEMGSGRSAQQTPGNAALLEQLRGADGNLAQHAILPPDGGPFDKRIALTFDDGPDVASTPRVLDILAEYGIQATFFVHGERIDSDEARAVVERITTEGHLLANHGERHDNFRRFPERAGRSIDATQARIDPFLGEREQRYFRFPGGNASEVSIRAAEERGQSVVGWHGDSMDWCYAEHGAVGACDLVEPRFRDDPVAHALNEARRYDGGILLFHDDRSYTAEILTKILDTLKAEGFSFTRLDDQETFPVLGSFAQALGGASASEPSFLFDEVVP